MINFEIIESKDVLKWNEYFQRLPIEQRDIYFTLEYFQLYENNENGKAKCFVYEKDGNIAIYPFMLNLVNELGYDLGDKYYDIQGVYGYNGILANTDSPIFLNLFFNCFDTYCKQNNVIAEFLRVNPVMQNLLLNRSNFKLIHDRDNINVNLSKENLFDTEYEHSTRKNIKKAIRNGLIFKSVLGSKISENELETFCSIYEHTMQRNNADDFYYFNYQYFVDLSANLNDKALFVFVLLDNKIISCELVLLGSNIAYSFLGGTLFDYYQYRPNDFLKNETINLLQTMGFDNFLLGGGSDGVFKYKSSFSKNGLIPFYIGKKIHNQEIYNVVVKQWEKKYPEKIEKNKNILLKYRY